MTVFITGTAGFIGFHLAQHLLDRGERVVGYDGITAYYDPRLKQARHAILQQHAGFTAIHGMLEDADLLRASIVEAQAEVVVHLAAQPGVRYSLEHPQSYISSNLVGTANLLEAIRAQRPRHFLFASTSSVYGGNAKLPSAELDSTDAPASLYAATKRSGEAMTHAYAHLWGIPTTCFRFFTVYGTWGRPDMALFKFVDLIEHEQPIEVFGDGQMQRDFTYVGDLVEAITRLVAVPPTQGRPVSDDDSLSPIAPWRVVNIGGGQPRSLLDFITIIEQQLGRQAVKQFLPMQKGEVARTAADPSLLRQLVGAVPETSLAQGVGAFLSWYRSVMPTLHKDAE